MKLEDVKRVLIVGVGTMGQEIGLQIAIHGLEVVFYDVSADAFEKAAARIQAVLDGFVSAGYLTREQVQPILARISYTTDPQIAAHEVDLVSESVPEDPALKAKVFAQFHQLCPPHTIFTTNSSSLLPSSIAPYTGRPAQFAALHFHHEVWVSNVVDVMPHSGTSPETVNLLQAFAKRIGQIPILVRKESNGYVFNAMYNALNREAITLAANGVASVEDVDRAWMGVMKMPIGPFGMLDGVGIDTAYHITAYWAGVLNDAQLKINAEFLKSYVDQGYLGVKSKRGFYSYPNPAFADAQFLIGK